VIDAVITLVSRLSHRPAGMSTFHPIRLLNGDNDRLRKTLVDRFSLIYDNLDAGSIKNDQSGIF
jgi:hypothetical protein